MIHNTDFRRGYLGRLDPESSKVDEWPSPGGPVYGPYGITVTADGMVWYTESGVTPNTVVRFDSALNQFAEWTVPSSGGTIRNMAATTRGNFYIACSGVNKIGIVRVER